MAQREDVERELQQTLERVKASNQQFAFDREGRPGAIAAIRGAFWGQATPKNAGFPDRSV